mmetsp:Transcript_25331/g.81651  ORF Transcript_25331/g.81651 Transcript_25331/m.81651 type:complete len:203 (+) Transcript_25331:136-744(+)
MVLCRLPRPALGAEAVVARSRAAPRRAWASSSRLDAHRARRRQRINGHLQLQVGGVGPVRRGGHAPRFLWRLRHLNADGACSHRGQPPRVSTRRWRGGWWSRCSAHVHACRSCRRCRGRLVLVLVSLLLRRLGRFVLSPLGCGLVLTCVLARQRVSSGCQAEHQHGGDRVVALGVAMLLTTSAAIALHACSAQPDSRHFLSR